MSKSYQYGIDQNYSGGFTVDNSDFWGFSDAIQFAWSSAAKPVTVRNSWFHNEASNGGVAHTDGILDNYGGVSHVVIDHNSIVGNGNTQGIALQGTTPYSDLAITGNYFSGYGYMLCIGSNMLSTNVTFTDNTWGTDIEPGWGPLYGNAMFTTPGLGNQWSANRIHVVPRTQWMAFSNNDLYWWPMDADPVTPRSVVGHHHDYRGPG